MESALKILIVGGYGTFGGRIVELLQNEERLTLIVAGRSLAKAQSYCTSRKETKARLIPAQLDRTSDIEGQLTQINPDIVIDASGPFQDYGKKSYALIETCIALRINYLDLADGSQFVAGVSALDKLAREANIFALSGVSSFPVLTAAVVRTLAADMDKVISIHGGIAPSPYAGVGSNVIRAIAGYAGQKMTLAQAGKDIEMWPLTSCMRYTIAPPGYLPLRNIRFSLVDVPDLRVLATVWPTATVWMGAGTVPEFLHRMLNFFSWMVRLRILKSISAFATLMDLVTRHIRWGEHRGGMFVEVCGTKKDIAVTTSWHLLAEGRDGPLIPSMAVEAIIRKLLAGEKIKSGARAALDDLTLDDYEKLFRQRTIYTGIRQDAPATSAALFQNLLGCAWDQLPPQIREMHDVKKTSVAAGIANIEHGNNLLGKMVRIALRFPKAGNNVPVQVRFDVNERTETWVRNFNGYSFKSHLRRGRFRSERLLTERFGIISFAMALVLKDNRLNLVLRRWSILGISLPMWLCPRSDSFEFVDEQGRFNFNVRISHPLTGLIVHYKGWLSRKA